jgi:hypothetical protein
VHNIYDPKYSSDESRPPHITSQRSSELPLGYTININESIDNSESTISSDSRLSVAEERDTISITPNAVTANLSRIMNLCSISRIIDQPSIMILDS